MKQIKLTADIIVKTNASAVDTPKMLLELEMYLNDLGVFTTDDDTASYVRFHFKYKP